MSYLCYYWYCIALTKKSVSGPPVTVIVGQFNERFTICKGLLCSSSAYFKTALSNEWKEAQDCTVKLPEDHAKSFKLYVQWLVSGKRKIYSMVTPKDSEEAHSEYTKEMSLLISSYCLGEKILDSSFKDCVLDAIKDAFRYEDYKWAPTGPCIDLLWTRTTSSSCARVLILSYFIWHGADHLIDCDHDQYVKNSEFWKDLAVGLVEFRTTSVNPSPLRSHGSCEFHEHDYAHECYKNRPLGTLSSNNGYC